MRSRYGWYLPLSKQELDEVWNSATVSLDANVLLDLYRYHDEARQGMFEALNHVKERLWISSQAADEFFRNRTTVISKTSAGYDSAKETLKKLEKALASARDTLRGHLLVPDSVAEELADGVLRVTSTAAAAVEEARKTRPDFLEHDPILDAVVDLFDDAVGPPPTTEQADQWRKEAKRRREEQIPPGYKDRAKEGDKADGDYFLWAQVLSQAKESERDLILVTSERKEDWWEIQSGRRVGPRRELVEEAHRESGQRVLLVSTERFVETIWSRRGTAVSQRLLFEIRHVSANRSAAERAREELFNIIEAAVDDLAMRLANEEPICALIAETNACGYSADQVEITNFGDLDLESAEVSFEARIRFSGDQDEDRMWHGDAINATIEGTVHFDGNEWLVKDDFTAAEIEHEEDDADRAGEEEATA